tara:strand:+ start:561 stop:1349 length:789 start_codon:yes stop_codon:yes gene_type:complete
MVSESDLIKKIKEKSELKGLANQLVKKQLSLYLEKDNLSLSNLSKQDQKIVVKEIRSVLRNLTGQYQKSTKKRSSLLEKESFFEILKTHSSTSERLSHYPEIKKKITPLKVKSILDLGCGLNPLALASKNYEYFASDIKEDELSIISSFFKKKKFSGKTFFFDLQSSKLSTLPKADLCIMFKVLDVVDKKPYKITQSLLKKVNCKYFLISFASKKLSGKKMNHPERKWFEHLLTKLKLKYSSFRSENEIFYLIQNNSSTTSD